MMRRFSFTHVIRFAGLAAGCALSLFVAAPAAAEGGNGGYEYCYTNHPDATGYIAGQPTYVSAVFRFPGDSYNGPALAQYVKQRFGVANPGPVGCSYGSRVEQAQNGYTTALAKIKAGGYKVVETGWVLSGAAANPPAPAGQVQSATAPPAEKSPHFFCTVSIGTKSYVSDVMPEVNPHLDAVRGFQSYLKQKYHPATAVALPSCPVMETEAETRAMFHQWALTAGANLVKTGWKYQGAAAPAVVDVAAAAVPAPSPAAPAAATVPAALAAVTPAVGTIVVRLIDPVNSFTDKPGKQYRAVVTQAVTIGHVTIPLNTLANVMVGGSGANLSAQLSSLALNGQPLNVTTTSVMAGPAAVNAGMAAAQETAKQVGTYMVLGPLAALKKKNTTATNAVNIMAQGDRVILPPGTSLTFTTNVPQTMMPAGSPAGQAPAPAANQGLVF